MDLPPHKKRILYIITQSSPWGGAQRYVHDIATALHYEGWAVTVAMGGDPHGTLFKKLNDERVPTRHLNTLTRAVRPLKNLRAIVEIRDLCGELNPDIVHLNSSMAGVLGALGARFAGVKKIVYTVHGLVTKEPLPVYLKLLYWVAEWIAGRFRNLTICVSEDDRRSVIRQHIASAEYAVTIPIGIDPVLPFLPRENARTYLAGLHPGLDTSRKWVGTIAGLYATKGLPFLVEAARQLTTLRQSDRFVFFIIGEGPEHAKLRKLIDAKKLSQTVLLLGSIPDAAHYLKAFDVFVLPSVKEGNPYTILEACVARIPIVASNIGGIPEVLRKGARHRLVLPAQPQLLAQAIHMITHKRGEVPLSEKMYEIPLLTHMIERTVSEYLQPPPPAR